MTDEERAAIIPLIAAIERFAAHCERDHETDTGDAWALLNTISDRLTQLVGVPVATAPGSHFTATERNILRNIVDAAVAAAARETPPQDGYYWVQMRQDSDHGGYGEPGEWIVGRWWRGALYLPGDDNAYMPAAVHAWGEPAIGRVAS